MLIEIIKNIIFNIAGNILSIRLENIKFKAKDFFKDLINNRFYKTLRENDFRAFKQTILRRYYTENCLTEINGRIFPAFCFKSAEIKKNGNDIKKYDASLLLESNKYLDCKFDEKEHQYYNKKRYSFLYSLVVGKKVGAGNRPGFMLDRLRCDKEGRVKSFQVYLGTYAENVYTSHVLEYELYLAYEIFKGKNIKDYWDKIVKFMKIRNEIDKSMRSDKRLKTSDGMWYFLKSGEGRHSLLGVQMLVLMKTEDRRYKLFLIKRSKDVAIASGYYQFVPSGGFEVFSDCLQGYLEEDIKDNLSAGYAVFREYLEEIFGDKKFQGKYESNVNSTMTNDKRIIEINKMIEDKAKEEDEKKQIENKGAWFEFLGSVVDLTVLKHDLSFALVIEDPNYLKNNFKGNNEAASYRFIDDIYLDNFEQKTKIWDNLHCSSAAMWKLFTESDLCKKLKPNSEQNESSQN